jgi:hypothetical protein
LSNGVYVSGLAPYEIAELPADVAKPRTASKLFRGVFDPLDELRAAKHIPQKTIAEKNGFKRAAWFEYKRKGTIPFHLLESVARYLGARLQASVITGMSEGVGITSATTEDETLNDYARKFAKLIEEVPEEQQEAAFGAAFTAARAAIRDLPFAEPSAESARASRGRSSKS